MKGRDGGKEGTTKRVESVGGARGNLGGGTASKEEEEEGGDITAMFEEDNEHLLVGVKVPDPVFFCSIGKFRNMLAI